MMIGLVDERIEELDEVVLETVEGGTVEVTVTVDFVGGTKLVRVLFLLLLLLLELVDGVCVLELVVGMKVDVTTVIEFVGGEIWLVWLLLLELDGGVGVLKVVTVRIDVVEGVLLGGVMGIVFFGVLEEKVLLEETVLLLLVTVVMMVDD